MVEAEKWTDLFHADFEVPLYDLTSTCFEGAMERNPKAKRGYSRDGRPDCLQAVIALVVTTDGFPLAYEMMNGNTTGCTTLREFLDNIETTYGKAKRMWVMDWGIPTEAILAKMHDPVREVSHLVGTHKSKIKQHEKHVLAKSEDRQAKEIAMRRKRPARKLRAINCCYGLVPRKQNRAVHSVL